MSTTGKKLIPRERIEFTQKLYLQGKPRPEISRRVCARFGVKARTARNYIALVEKHLASLPKPPPEATFVRVESMLLQAYDHARRAVKVVKWQEKGESGKGAKGVEYSKTLRAPETGAMVNAAWRLAELHGLVVDRIDHTSNGKTLAPLDPSDPRWSELQRTVYGSERQGVSDATRPDGDPAELDAGDVPPVPAPVGA